MSRPWQRSLPLQALHYDLGKVGSLADVVAPPYDVIDDAQRAELAGRSPYNVVELDLPARPRRRRSLRARREAAGQWTSRGRPDRDDRSPRSGRSSRTTPLPTAPASLAAASSPACRLAQYGEGIRPHERTQPGPKEDRLRLTRATRHNLSPDLRPASRRRLAPPGARRSRGNPWGEVTDGDGTTHRVWRIGDPAVHEAIAAELAARRAADRRRPPPLRDLARLSARGRRRRSGRLRPDGAGLARGPRPDGLPHPPPDLRPRRRPRQAGGARHRPAGDLRRRGGARRISSIPGASDGIGVFGYIDSHFKRGLPAAAARQGPALDEALGRPLRAPTASSTPRSSRSWSSRGSSA